jgi:hypothetical protein
MLRGIFRLDPMGRFSCAAVARSGHVETRYTLCRGHLRSVKATELLQLKGR